MITGASNRNRFQNSCGHRCIGATLVELIASIAIMTVLLGAMGSAIFLSTKALPTADNPAADAIAAARVADQIIAELEVAKSFLTITAPEVEFTVADRDTPTDGNDEAITYKWSGEPGSPLTRRYNSGGNTVNVLDSVYEFALAYNVKPPGPDGPLLSVRVTLNTTTSGSTRIETTALVLNTPEIMQ